MPATMPIVAAHSSSLAGLELGQGMRGVCEDALADLVQGASRTSRPFSGIGFQPFVLHSSGWPTGTYRWAVAVNPCSSVR